MLAAFATSSLFLACYLVYHYQVGSVPFARQGIVRPIYFGILITHVVLAATVPRWPWSHCPGAFRHVRPTWPSPLDLPIWLYVSVTGVLVYVLLYQPTWLL